MSASASDVRRRSRRASGRPGRRGSGGPAASGSPGPAARGQRPPARCRGWAGEQPQQLPAGVAGGAGDRCPDHGQHYTHTRIAASGAPPQIHPMPAQLARVEPLTGSTRQARRVAPHRSAAAARAASRAPAVSAASSVRSGARKRRANASDFLPVRHLRALVDVEQPHRLQQVAGARGEGRLHVGHRHRAVDDDREVLLGLRLGADDGGRRARSGRRAISASRSSHMAADRSGSPPDSITRGCSSPANPMTAPSSDSRAHRPGWNDRVVAGRDLELDSAGLGDDPGDLDRVRPGRRPRQRPTSPAARGCRSARPRHGSAGAAGGR